MARSPTAFFHAAPVHVTRPAELLARIAAAEAICHAACAPHIAARERIVEPLNSELDAIRGRCMEIATLAAEYPHAIPGCGRYVHYRDVAFINEDEIEITTEVEDDHYERTLKPSTPIRMPIRLLAMTEAELRDCFQQILDAYKQSAEEGKRLVAERERARVLAFLTHLTRDELLAELEARRARGSE